MCVTSCSTANRDLGDDSGEGLYESEGIREKNLQFMIRKKRGGRKKNLDKNDISDCHLPSSVLIIFPIFSSCQAVCRYLCLVLCGQASFLLQSQKRMFLRLLLISRADSADIYSSTSVCTSQTLMDSEMFSVIPFLTECCPSIFLLPILSCFYVSWPSGCNCKMEIKVMATHILFNS